MTQFLFPTRAFGKKQPLSVDDFKNPNQPAPEKPVKVVNDLIFKNGTYHLNSKFLENDLVLVPVLSEDTITGFLLQSKEETFGETVGIIKSAKFKSSILDVILTQVGINKEAPIYLIKEDGEEFNVFRLSDQKYTKDVVKDSFEEVKSIADPTDFSSIQDDSIKDTSEVDMLANVSIEEVSHNLGFSNKPLEELL